MNVFFLKGDVSALRIYSGIISFFTLITATLYLINVCTEVRGVFKKKQSIGKLPILFDIPLFQCFGLYLISFAVVIPRVVGEKKLICVPGTDDATVTGYD